MKNTYRACNWLILSDGYDPHYIESPKCQKDALLDHTEWSQGERNLELYQKAFDGFDDMNEAIQLFNTIFEYCEIRRFRFRRNVFLPRRFPKEYPE